MGNKMKFKRTMVKVSNRYCSLNNERAIGLHEHELNGYELGGYVMARSFILNRDGSIEKRVNTWVPSLKQYWLPLHIGFDRKVGCENYIRILMELSGDAPVIDQPDKGEIEARLQSLHPKWFADLQLANKVAIDALVHGKIEGGTPYHDRVMEIIS